MRRDGAKPLGDRVRVLHMRDAAREAIEFVAGKTRDDLNTNGMLRRALHNCIQEIGEAASHVTDAGRARVPDLPWPQIVGMRHRVVHVYYDIDRNALWEVVERHLHPLIEATEKALADWPEE